MNELARIGFLLAWPVIGLGLVVLGPVTDGVHREQRRTAEQFRKLAASISAAMKAWSDAMPKVEEAVANFTRSMHALAQYTNGAHK